MEMDSGIGYMLLVQYFNDDEYAWAASIAICLNGQIWFIT